MSSLILTVISIVLLSAIAVVTLNYLPGWTKEQGEVFPVIRGSAQQLERAFTLYAKGHADTPAPVIGGNVDGGLAAQFSAFVGFTPAAIPGYRWVYGANGPGAPAGYQNTYFFCMVPSTPGLLASEGKVRGAFRAKQYLSGEQAFVSSSCGTPGDGNYSSYPAPLTFTYFVRYVPGQA